MLSQLSYAPWFAFLAYLYANIKAGLGLGGLEPPTSRLSGVRSNQLSYKPILLQSTNIILAEICSGNLLFSRAVASQVPSAAHSLTLVFEMGTSVSHERIITGNF